METYKLQTLLMFFKLQQAIGYQTIETVLRIMEDPELPDHHVRPYIRQFLREAGLNETTHKEGKFTPSDEYRTRLDRHLQQQPPILDVNVHFQKAEVNLLSGKHQFHFILN